MLSVSGVVAEISRMHVFSWEVRVSQRTLDKKSLASVLAVQLGNVLCFSRKNFLA